MHLHPILLLTALATGVDLQVGWASAAYGGSVTEDAVVNVSLVD